MEWRDSGILLTSRRHGEAAAIIEVFTQDHGRHAGVVQGGGARRMAPILQPGAQLAVSWRARLEDHIGTFSVEPIQSRAAGLMADALTLAAFGTVAALLSQGLPEREAHPQLYAHTITLANSLALGSDWLAEYVRWELLLLRELGYGLDLDQCAVTAQQNDLAYVSPKTGRAVSRAAAGEWADKLLPLPDIMLGGVVSSPENVVQALTTTGYFLEHRAFPALGHRQLPAARARLIAALQRRFN
ncbi:DNA repair protein RecO [Abyssibius alkaniclasticus]|uniref:DNA repair protein RecO n=1 Tax=Abyssibius alkaniclasticus TaxID=2881234 RepID=UPI0040587021